MQCWMPTLLANSREEFLISMYTICNLMPKWCVGKNNTKYCDWRLKYKARSLKLLKIWILASFFPSETLDLKSLVPKQIYEDLTYPGCRISLNLIMLFCDIMNATTASLSTHNSYYVTSRMISDKLPVHQIIPYLNSSWISYRLNWIFITLWFLE